VPKNVVKESEYKRRAWELCRRGFNTRDIAYKLSTVDSPITTARVKAWLDEDLREINELNRRDATEWRELELSRLDELYTTLRESLLQTIQDDFGLGTRAAIDLEDPIVFVGYKLKAIQIATNIVDKCAKISDSRSKLLGLYAPVQTETSGNLSVDGTNYAALSDEQLKLKFAEIFG
jgi:arsenate reductase-like glutaredoxin family protein